MKGIESPAPPGIIPLGPLNIAKLWRSDALSDVILVFSPKGCSAGRVQGSREIPQAGPAEELGWQSAAKRKKKRRARKAVLQGRASDAAQVRAQACMAPVAVPMLCMLRDRRAPYLRLHHAGC